jgi:hypothetical protein
MFIASDSRISLSLDKFKTIYRFDRILEFEKEVRDGKTRKKHSFEIWDVSGNRA